MHLRVPSQRSAGAWKPYFAAPLKASSDRPNLTSAAGCLHLTGSAQDFTGLVKHKGRFYFNTMWHTCVVTLVFCVQKLWALTSPELTWGQVKPVQAQATWNMSHRKLKDVKLHEFRSQPRKTHTCRFMNRTSGPGVGWVTLFMRDCRALLSPGLHIIQRHHRDVLICGWRSTQITENWEIFFNNYWSHSPEIFWARPEPKVDQIWVNKTTEFFFFNVMLMFAKDQKSEKERGEA